MVSHNLQLNTSPDALVAPDEDPGALEDEYQAQESKKRLASQLDDSTSKVEQNPINVDIIYIFNFIVKQGIKKYREKVMESPKKELQQMESKIVWKPVDANIEISGKMFTSNGEF